MNLPPDPRQVRLWKKTSLLKVKLYKETMDFFTNSMGKDGPAFANAAKILLSTLEENPKGFVVLSAKSQE
jgi:hypothetical protein